MSDDSSRSGGKPRNASGPKSDSRTAGRPHAPRSEWHDISEELQLALATQAMRRAAMIIAGQADLFAVQFENATLQDRGAVEALKLFATLLRETTAECLKPVGNA